MENVRAAKFAAAGGLLFVAALVVSTLLPGASPPMADDSTVKVIAYFADHRDGILVGSYAGGIGVVFALLFASGLRNFLRTAEGELAGPSTLGFAGGVATVAVATAITGFSTVLAYRLPAADPALVRSLYDANLLCFSLLGFPIAVFVGGYSAAVARTGALPRWLAMLGGVVALINLVGAASFAKSGAFMPGGAIGFAAFIGFLIWVLAMSVALLAHLRAGKPAA